MKHVHFKINGDDLVAFVESIHRLPRRSAVLTRAMRKMFAERAKIVTANKRGYVHEFRLTPMEAAAVDSAYIPSTGPRGGKAAAVRGKMEFNKQMHEQNVSLTSEEYAKCVDRL